MNIQLPGGWFQPSKSVSVDLDSFEGALDRLGEQEEKKQQGSDLSSLAPVSPRKYLYISISNGMVSTDASADSRKLTVSQISQIAEEWVKRRKIPSKEEGSKVDTAMSRSAVDLTHTKTCLDKLVNRLDKQSTLIGKVKLFFADFFGNGGGKIKALIRKIEPIIQNENMQTALSSVTEVASTQAPLSIIPKTTSQVPLTQDASSQVLLPVTENARAQAQLSLIQKIEAELKKITTSQDLFADLDRLWSLLEGLKKSLSIPPKNKELGAIRKKLLKEYGAILKAELSRINSLPLPNAEILPKLRQQREKTKKSHTLRDLGLKKEFKETIDNTKKKLQERLDLYTKEINNIVDQVLKSEYDPFKKLMQLHLQEKAVKEFMSEATIWKGNTALLDNLKELIKKEKDALQKPQNIPEQYYKECKAYYERLKSYYHNHPSETTPSTQLKTFINNLSDLLECIAPDAPQREEIEGWMKDLRGFFYK